MAFPHVSSHRTALSSRAYSFPHSRHLCNPDGAVGEFALCFRERLFVVAFPLRSNFAFLNFLCRAARSALLVSQLPHPHCRQSVRFVSRYTRCSKRALRRASLASTAFIERRLTPSMSRAISREAGANPCQCSCMCKVEASANRK